MPFFEPNFARISSETNFTINEVKQIYDEFKKISGSEIKDSLLDFSEFKKSFKIKSELLAKLVFQVFDIDNSGYIDFEEYVIGINQISENSSIETRAKFLFLIYDKNRTRYLDEDALKELTKLSLSEVQQEGRSKSNMDPLHISIIRNFRKDASGKIRLDNFIQGVKNFPQVLDWLLRIKGFKK